MTGIDERRLATFLGTLLVVSVGFVLAIRALDMSIMATGPAYMFTPLVAVLVVTRIHGIGLRTIGVRIGRRRWLVYAAVVWPPLALLMTGIALLVPGVTFDPSPIVDFLGVTAEPGWLVVGMLGMVGMMVVVGGTVNALLGFGEEAGWRGYLLWELSNLGFWKASAVIGALWGIWHTPLVLAGHNYPTFPLLGLVLFPIVCIAITPLFTYVAVRGKSVFPAAILHGVYNTGGFIAMAGTDDAVLRELIASNGGVVGLLVYAAIIAAIAITGAPSLDRIFEDEPGVPTRSRPTRESTQA